MMKSFAKLLAVAVALAVPTLAAHADQITGSLNLTGGDSYTSSSITFSNIGNTVFDGAPGTLPTDFNGGALIFGPAGTTVGTPYTVNGTNYLGDTLFTIAGLTGDTLSFTLTDITSFSYNPTGTDYGLEGTGSGTLTLVATDGTSTSTTGLFTLSSQEQPGTTGDTTDVSFSSTVLAPTPEPSSLLLIGTGLLGSAGMLYRRNRTSAS